MKIYKIEPQGFAANTYLLTEDNKTCVAVDPAQDRVVAIAKEMGLSIRDVLLTHGHFDHTGACNGLFAAGATIYCHEIERSLALGENSLYLQHGAPVPAFGVKTFRGGDVLDLCGMKITVVHTPGHTAGSVCFATDEGLITGDTLFSGCVGRCDLPTGDEVAIVKSVKKLYELFPSATVYPGHDENTTIEREKKYNYNVRA